VLLREEYERGRVNTRKGGLEVLGPGRVKTEDRAETLDERGGSEGSGREKHGLEKEECSFERAQLDEGGKMEKKTRGRKCASSALRAGDHPNEQRRANHTRNKRHGAVGTLASGKKRGTQGIHVRS